MNSESVSRSGFESVLGAAANAVDLLDDLMARVGVDGMAAALQVSGLQATVDQHAAAIRQSIVKARRRVDAESLTAYARSVVAVIHRTGRRLPEPGEADFPHLDWAAAPSYLVRLVAVCTMAEAAGCL